MADLIIRLVNRSEVIYIDYYGVHGFTTIKDDEGWWVCLSHEDPKAELVSTRIEKFASKAAAEQALDNICKALAFEYKYVTLLPDGNIEVVKL